MNGNQTLNLNAAQCIKSNDHFGYTAIHNICSGTLQNLSWGFFDWFWTVLLALGAFAIVALLFCAAFQLLTLD